MKAEEQESRWYGVFLAFSAFILWGITPIYFKFVDEVSPLEILCHRAIWSFFFLAVLLHTRHHWPLIKDILSHKIKMMYLTSSGLLIGANWLTFIWAVTNHRMLDASLGYFINPLLSIFLGIIFLGESLSKLQLLAITLASGGVLLQLVLFGSVPFVAMILAISFSVYGLLRKKVNVEAQAGLFVETLILLPVAVIYLFFIANSPTSKIMNNSWQLNSLLFSAGAITMLPLLCFTGAVPRLRLSTLGLFQYLAPSLMFLLAVVIYNEPLTADKIITFSFIWGALFLYSFDALRNQGK